MAGLSCALQLANSRVPVKLLEGSDRVGGRVRTDSVDGYLVDRGFQVYLDAYPSAGELLQLDRLDLRSFEPGALVWRGGKLHRVMDVFRRPRELMTSAMVPVGSFWDKLKVGSLRYRLLRKPVEEIWADEEISTEAYLRRFGFSERMIDEFFRGFYGGIFLERELRTSSRMFEFTFKMFSLGAATVPAGGMGEIPRQLHDRLTELAGKNTAEFGQRVQKIEKIRDLNLRDGKANFEVLIEGGESLAARALVIATEMHEAVRLIPGREPTKGGWRSEVSLAYAVKESPFREPLIALNGEGAGLVNNVCDMTTVAPGYAPADEGLVMVTVLGSPELDGLSEGVLNELNQWFGGGVNSDSWSLLQMEEIKHALPEQLPGEKENEPAVEVGGIWRCGDYLVSASIDGAVISGRKAADLVQDSLFG